MELRHQGVPTKFWPARPTDGAALWGCCRVCAEERFKNLWQRSDVPFPRSRKRVKSGFWGGRKFLREKVILQKSCAIPTLCGADPGILKISLKEKKLRPKNRFLNFANYGKFWPFFGKIIKDSEPRDNSTPGVIISFFHYLEGFRSYSRKREANQL